MQSLVFRAAVLVDCIYKMIWPTINPEYLFVTPYANSSQSVQFLDWSQTKSNDTVNCPF